MFAVVREGGVVIASVLGLVLILNLLNLNQNARFYEFWAVLAQKEPESCDGTEVTLNS